MASLSIHQRDEDRVSVDGGVHEKAIAEVFSGWVTLNIGSDQVVIHGNFETLATMFSDAQNEIHRLKMIREMEECAGLVDAF